MNTAAEPFSHCTGPRRAKLAVVGEAPGQSEELLQSPFVGVSGAELAKLLGEAGLTASPPRRFLDQLFLLGWWPQQSLFLTNVFTARPPNNEIELFCASKAEVGGKDYTLPPLRMGKYVKPECLELNRLRAELEEVRPNLVLALGNAACWALLGTMPKIGQLRGAVTTSTLVPGLKVLPTYHPAAVLRNWALRPIIAADLLKARREAEFPEVCRPRREVLVNPTLAELRAWCVLPPTSALAVDIETRGELIEMIGFARSPTSALVIPFIRQDGGSYWSEADELTAWGIVAQLLESPVPKIFQNGLFDLQFLAKMGLRVRNCLHDTMLLHHSLYIELQKGLGFLGSVYTDELSWKQLRSREGNKLEE